MLLNVTLVKSDGLLGVQVGPETHFFDEAAIRELLHADPDSRDVLRAIARRLNEDNVNPRTATFAQVKTSVERAALEV